MIVKGLAVARGRDTEEVSRLVAARALAQNPHPQIGILFASQKYDQEVLFKTIRSSLGGIPIFGTTTPYGITNRGVEHDSVLLLLLSSDDLDFKVVAGKCEDNPNEVARYLASKFLVDIPVQPGDSIACISSSSQHHGKGGEFLRGLNEVFPFRVPVSGGATVGAFPSDDWEALHRGTQYCGDIFATGFLNFLFLRAKDPKNLRFGFAFESGWEPVSHPVICTRTEGNRVFEVDGIPILQYLKSYLGEGFHDQIFFARSKFSFIARLKEGATEKTVIRVPFRCDFQKPSVLFWPEGNYQDLEIQLVQLSREDLLDGAEKAAQAAVDGLEGFKPELVLVFSCTVRSLLLHSWANQEIERVGKVVGSNVPIIGMYANAEFGPIYNRYREVIDRKRALSGSQELGCSISLLVVGSQAGSGAGTDYRQALDGQFREDEARAARTPDERISELSGLLAEAEKRLFDSEKSLRYINREHYKANISLQERNEQLAEANRRSEKLQEVIRQYTPHEVWRKASATVMAGLYRIPDEELRAAFMFMDVKGFTSYAEKHTPAEVISGINAIFQPATELVYSEGGDIDKFIWDCIFAKFPTAEKGLRAAIGIQQLMERLRKEGSPFSVRIGMNFGRVVSGNVGAPMRRENALIGDAVNLSQRLESACPPGSILVSAEFFHSFPPPSKPCPPTP